MKEANVRFVRKQPEALSPVTREQTQAITLMVQGKTVKEAAREVGVHRGTLFRWMREDPSFIAAFNAWRRETQQVARAQLLGMTGDAVTAVRDAVVNGDGRLALALLKGMGLLTPEAMGSDDPEIVRQEMDLAKREAAVRIKGAEGEVLMDEVAVGL